MAVSQPPTMGTSVFADDGMACVRELSYDCSLLARSFRAKSEGFQIDFMSSEEEFSRRSITDDDALDQILMTPLKADSQRTRIFSVASRFSNEPLSITRPAMQQMAQKLDVNMSFVQIISAFGEKPRRSEAALNCFNMIKKPDGSFEIMYLFRFAEGKDDPDNDEWQLRQIGIYHRHDRFHQTNSSDDVFILLQPHESSMLDEYLGDIADNSYDRSLLTEHPVKLHTLLFQIYFSSGWRGYLHQASETFTKQSDQIFTEGVYKDEGVTYHTLREWRDLADRIMPVPAIIESQSRILEGLQHGFSSSTGSSSGSGSSGSSGPSGSNTIMTNTTTLPTQFHLSMAQGFKSSAEVLQARIDGVIGLLANTIDMKNQWQTHILNRHMRSLTQDTVDDSANVKIVTVMSLVYLPASFLATLFGMNFFDFDSIRRRISVSKDFWIFFVLVIPLTFSTVGSWLVLSRRAKTRREKRIPGGNDSGSGTAAHNSSQSSSSTSKSLSSSSSGIGNNNTTGNTVVSRASTTMSMTEMGRIPRPIRLSVRG